MRSPQKNALTIFGILPEFLGRSLPWYEEHEKRLRSHPLENPILREWTITLEVGMRTSVPELLRRLDELGYEKVLSVGRYGEFAHRGGIVDIFPINTDKPFRIEFDGNAVGDIVELSLSSDLTRREWEKIVRRTVTAPLEDIREGDFLVHLDHGIGRFLGRTKLTIDGETRTYLSLEYAAGDRLYVPEEIAERKLSRYIGFAKPTLHRLGGTSWLATKRRVREEAKRFAEELLTLYANRILARRPPYPTTNPILDAFIASFPYEETPDQIRAFHDILRDLASAHPMDRLLAGDVGFGKTEVALRAAVLVASEGGQVAMLTPTTVLADQHFRLAHDRLADVGVTSALLTRLQSPKETRLALEGLKTGRIDIVIGTHRILSEDVRFKNLRLLIIDEEQRFGVRHKERLKKIRQDLDVLSLTATPIPRTLAQALADIHPVSRLRTAPPGRREIITHFQPWNPSLVREALLSEKRRGGQSYILHNRIATIASFLKELKTIAPKLRYGIVHSKLSERQLIAVMEKLRSGAIDVLISTTIIENGLDLANVNTLIVEDATRLGLAQAYQLRGRIGRSEIQAYAYFLWRGREPEGKARARLDALREATAIGSGWKLALRDLEIRGAGNLLGREQSGLVNRVGFNLYAQLLAESVEALRAERQKKTSNEG
jgi:transcription-repair coupling factor (superfamily II helicase)